MRGAEIICRLGPVLQRFRRNRSGGLLVYTTLMLPVLFGVTLLAIDASRVYALQTSLQKGADAFALAAAAELDGNGDAITRADNALNTLVANSQKFGVTPGTVAVQHRYLTGLPVNDADPIDASYDTVDPTAARFVEVLVTPVQMDTFFPATFIGAASNSLTTGAVAVAGFGSAVCKFTPLFMCNPYEGVIDPDTGQQLELSKAANDPIYARRQIELRQIGGNQSQYSPGNYGFLEPHTGNPGADALRDMLALENPPACFLANGVNLRPGFIATTGSAVNVRFDIFDQAMNSAKNNGDMRPAKNVTKGYTAQGNACNSSPDETNAKGLPRDTCFTSGSCTNMSGRMGDGVWDFAGYWLVNHGTTAVPAEWLTTPPSRYQVYRYEVDNNLIPQAGASGGTTQENGNTSVSACHSSGGVDSSGLDRRLLFGAVLNCQALQAAGYDLQGSQGNNLPVAAFMKFFLTEPVGSSQDQSLWVEITDIVSPGSNGGNDVARDIVQLYR
jgi:Flp pilus assembly protein TadG